VLAITAAAVAFEESSALFVFLGSVVVGAYLTFTAVAQLPMARRDFEDRLSTFELVVDARGLPLSKAVTSRLHEWRSQLRSRVCWMKWSLIAFALVLVTTGGIAALWMTVHVDGLNKFPAVIEDSR
jgi:hypothetical protein